MHLMRTSLICLFLGFYAIGCERGEKPYHVISPCGGQLQIQDVAPWPGKGLGMRVKVFGQENDALTSEDFILEFDEEQVPVTVSHGDVEHSYIALLLDISGDPEDVRERLDAAASVLQVVGDSSVGVFVRCSNVEQLVGFTKDKLLIKHALDSYDPNCSFEPMYVEGAIKIARKEVTEIGGACGNAQRAVVFIGGSRENVNSDEFVNAESVRPEIHLFFRHDGGNVCSGSRMSIHEYGDTGTLVEKVGNIVGERSSGVYFVGSCPARGEQVPFDLVLNGAGPPESGEIPAGPEEEKAGQCDAARIAENSREFPRQIHFIFTPEELSAYETGNFSVQDDDFFLSVALGDGAPVSAKAHHRGNSTASCSRKNFSVNLKSNKPRHLLPGYASDEFYLISMCQDDRYIQQFTANTLATELGLFALHFGFVELIFNGETKGVYLLLEKSKDGLLASNSRLKTIVRRGMSGSFGGLDPKYPKDVTIDDPMFQGLFDLESNSELLQGESLVTYLNKHMNLDAFLRNIALQAALANSDTADELFFYSTEADKVGPREERFHIHPWDMDDLFDECMSSSEVDPFDLAGCVEGDLEKSLLGDATIYALYADRLEELLNNHLTEDAFIEAAKRTEEMLLPFFDDPSVCCAMSELVDENPAATSPEAAKADISDHIDSMISAFINQRDLLLNNLENYNQ